MRSYEEMKAVTAHMLKSAVGWAKPTVPTLLRYCGARRVRRCAPLPALRHYGAALVALAACAIATAAHAQPRRDPGEIHGLKLGLKADEMSTDTFGDLACGSNGGPPRQAIDDWSEFRKCRPEPSGLYEVNARFDDEQEYIGRAIDDPDPLYAQGRVGTRVAGHPVILSVLFDKDGVLRGIRMVSDPRASIVERRMAHMLRLAVINRYDPEGWTCADLPPAPGETPVGGGVFIKQRCEKRTAERDLFVEAHFLRKPGQSGIDPATGEPTTGQFESWTRFELMDPNYKKP
ncbi:MAG TPA: hypothetical protein VKT99_01085 [Xanthobacteraceae bacterium]|nr:hypothetical protein [Xanthobacteraceae bacterium]